MDLDLLHLGRCGVVRNGRSGVHAFGTLLLKVRARRGFAGTVEDDASSKSARLPHEGPGQQRTSRIRRVHRRQVFGLAGISALYERDAGFLAAAASQAAHATQCSMATFVPVYRCGAVPDLHRVPF